MIYYLKGHQVRRLPSLSAIVHPLNAHCRRVPVDEDDRDVLRSGQDVLLSSHTADGHTVAAAQVGRRRRRQIVGALCSPKHRKKTIDIRH